MLQMHRVIDELSEHTEVDAQERVMLNQLLSLVAKYAEENTMTVEPERHLAIASHLLAFVRRVENTEYLEDMDTSMFKEVDSKLIGDSKNLLQSYCTKRSYTVTDTEALLLAIHFAVCGTN